MPTSKPHYWLNAGETLTQQGHGAYTVPLHRSQFPKDKLEYKTKLMKEKIEKNKKQTPEVNVYECQVPRKNMNQVTAVPRNPLQI